MYGRGDRRRTGIRSALQHTGEDKAPVFTCLDQLGGGSQVYVERLLAQYVQAASRGLEPLAGMQPRGSADVNGVYMPRVGHRANIREGASAQGTSGLLRSLTNSVADRGDPGSLHPGPDADVRLSDGPATNHAYSDMRGFIQCGLAFLRVLAAPQTPMLGPSIATLRHGPRPGPGQCRPQPERRSTTRKSDAPP